MKLALLASLLLATATLAPAQTDLPYRAGSITTTSGKLLTNATIIDQTGDTVRIRFDQGIATIRKDDLPSELQSLFPLDEDRVRRERAAEKRRYEAAIALMAKQEADRKAAARAQIAAPQPPPPLPPGQPVEQDEHQARQLAMEDYIASRAEKHADTWFSQHAPSRNKNYLKIDASITIDTVESVPGWAGRWRCKGTAVQQIYRSYASFETVRRPFTILIFDDGKSRKYEMETAE